MLEQARIDEFKTTGYTLVPDFFDARELAALRTELRRFRREGLLRNVATAGDGVTPTSGAENLQLVPIAPVSELYRALPFAPSSPSAPHTRRGPT